MNTVNKPFRKKDAMQLVTGQPVYMEIKSDLFQEKTFQVTVLSELFQSRKAKKRELIILRRILQLLQFVLADFLLCLIPQLML